MGWLQFSNISVSAVVLIQWNQALLFWVVQIVAFWDVTSCTCVVVYSPFWTSLGLSSWFWLIMFWCRTCILNPEDGGSVFSQNVGVYLYSELCLCVCRLWKTRWTSPGAESVTEPLDRYAHTDLLVWYVWTGKWENASTADFWWSDTFRTKVEPDYH
jgi:hypothetical protein